MPARASGEPIHQSRSSWWNAWPQVEESTRPYHPAPMADLQPQRPPLWQSTWFQLGLVLVVAGSIYWPMLGSSGFAFSEGQRALPGWTFASEGDWFIPRLLDQPYLRKPPGMPWVIAA